MKNSEFIKYLKEKERSDKTIKAYSRDINQFEEYLAEKMIKEIHNNSLKEYRDYLLYEKSLSPITVNRKLVAINQYCSFNEIPVLNIRAKYQLQNF